MPTRKKQHHPDRQITSNEGSTFMEDLQESLLTSHDQSYGIDAFQSVFNKKKTLNMLLERQKKAKSEVKNAQIKTKQRIAQIQQLNGKVQRQTSLLKSQIQKITDAHNVAKILMMEKIVKLQRETDELQRRKNQCFEARVQKQRVSMLSNDIMHRRRVNTRLGSLSATLEMKKELQTQKYQTLHTNRTKAESVKAEEQRRRTRSQRIQQYKLDRARKNYQYKIDSVRSRIENAEDTLQNLYSMEVDEEKVYKATTDITTNYMKTFFPTETI